MMYVCLMNQSPHGKHGVAKPLELFEVVAIALQGKCENAYASGHERDCASKLIALCRVVLEGIELKKHPGHIYIENSKKVRAIRLAGFYTQVVKLATGVVDTPKQQDVARHCNTLIRCCQIVSGNERVLCREVDELFAASAFARVLQVEVTRIKSDEPSLYQMLSHEL